ncbi:hypothetical protein E2C01_076378 [Portunus trituberculatus]|uniref:Uncharacterized protein n=1 Tax=Portunus trituberculatus TaxID=210409 RepID=A0A5B7IIE1_PORTR|nr:hypothetical protein [Portunus trituberculatus]
MKLRTVASPLRKAQPPGPPRYPGPIANFRDRGGAMGGSGPCRRRLLFRQLLINEVLSFHAMIQKRPAIISQ